MHAPTRPAVVVLVALCAPAAARAQAAGASLSGDWQAGATTMNVAVESWGPDCGPKPQSTHSSGGGRVQLEQAGDTLIIHGRDRDVRSDHCWSPNPAIHKTGSSHNSTTWITRCKTAASDPRTEEATYTLRLESPDRLVYEDKSHFDWRLNDSTCVATITTTQTLARVKVPSATESAPGTPPTRPAAGPAAVETPEPAPCVPGPAARLRLRPRHADIQLGGRVCFEPSAVDAKGCALPAPEVSWQLDHGPGIRGRLDAGCFRAESGAAEGEGAFRVIASYGSLRAEAAVRVSAASLPALIAQRLDSGAIEGDSSVQPDAGSVAASETGTPPATATTRVPAATGVVARTVAAPEQEQRRLMQLLALGTLLLAAGVLATVILRRRRSTRRPTTAPRAQRAAHVGVRSLRCPRCGARYPEGSAFCGNDGAALEAADGT